MLQFVISVIYLCVLVNAGDECNDALIAQGGTILTATSSLPSRGPANARMTVSEGAVGGDGTGAWVAALNNYYQQLTIGLPKRSLIKNMHIKGLSGSSFYVSEFYIHYSDDGEAWSTRKDSTGEAEMFKGNDNGDKTRRISFETPIIAQWIRINPTRWHDRISMKVEVYGCLYKADVLHFAGNSLVRKNLTLVPVSSRRDKLNFRFRTNRADGLLLYSRGTQGDYLALQLLQNRLVLNLNIGSGLMTSMTVGSLLDDNLWHDVMIVRNRRDVIFTVDRVMIKDKIKGDYAQLDLDREFLIGGSPTLEEGMLTIQNFTGCMENFFINGTNVIRAVRDASHEDHWIFTAIKVSTSCPAEQVIPITFLTASSYARLPSYEGTKSLNVSLAFRTYEENGLLAYHKFTSDGSVKVYLETGKIKVDLISKQVSRIVLDNFAETWNDGRWHTIVLTLAENSLILNINGRAMKTVRLLTFLTGAYTLIGGGVPGSPGFLGCMRQINVDGHTKIPTSWKPEEFCCKGEIVFDACQMVDKCTPNPCEHGGMCKQTSEDFYCDCTHTGYTGAVCHASTHPVSCDAAHQSALGSPKIETNIDVDGSGPLPAFPVTCEYFNDGRTLTYVGHQNDQTTVVNGFNAPGSFIQNIAYNADMDQIGLLVNRSYACRQRLRYDCRSSRLFNSPYASESQEFRPNSWWVSRQNLRMDYWAGSLPGSRKCECGIYGTCVDKTKWCNCDSGLETWLADEGELTEKEHLPVRQLRFGDTGTPLDEKEGKYTLGSLICEGDVMVENVVTFRVADATIDFPTFDIAHSGDITFEFRTTQENAVLIHSKGPVDFIKVSIVGGDQIQFTYQAGSGPLGVTVETSTKLNDNQWHSVSVERNRKEARVVVDGALKAEVREPPGPVRAMHLTSPFVVGSTVDYKDGFVGCMRGLMLNGRHMDMRSAALRGLYGIGLGCTGKCDSSPCLNNGTCHEGYDRYTCDCRFTSFKGPICADEIGVNMQSNYMIKYEFPGTYKSTLSENIRVGFTTTNPKGFLMGLFSDISKEYLTLSVSNSGSLRLIFDFGFERREFIFANQTFATGQYHDVRIRREEGGSRVVMIVDNYEPQYQDYPINPSADAQFNNIQYMYLGRNNTITEGFTGCLSRVEFDDIYPLKWLFQQNRPNSIKSFPDAVSEDFCGIEPVTHPPDVRETRPPPNVDEEELQKFYPPAHSAILGGILAVLFIALVCMAILIGRYMSRHKGDYVTQEDKGAENAADADFAVMHSTTGHHVEKKKEWFI